MTDSSTLYFSFVPHARHAGDVDPWDGTFEELADELKEHGREWDTTKDGPAIIPATFREGEHKRDGRTGRFRQSHLVEKVYGLFLDFEETPGTREELCGPLAGFDQIRYSTWSHGDPAKWEAGEPRFRALIPLARPIDPDEYAALWSHVFELLDGAIDKQCSDPTRLMYTPRPKNPDAEREPWFETIKGARLDPDAIPAKDGGTVSVSDLLEAAQRERESTGAKDARERKGSSAKRIRSALACLSSEPRADWIKYGQCLHHWGSTGGGTQDRAFSIWDDWSKPSNKYDSDNQRAKWDSFGNYTGEPVTLGTLFHDARKAGWTDPARFNWKVADHAEMGRALLAALQEDSTEPAVFAEDELWTWDGAAWKRIPEHELSRNVWGWSGTHYQSGRDANGDPKSRTITVRAGDVRGAIQAACDLADNRPRFFADAPRGAAFGNVFIGANLEAGELYQDTPTPDHRIRAPFAIELDEDAQCPRFRRYLCEVFEPDADAEDKIKLLQEFAGASLLGIAPQFQKALVLHGEGNNGKSVFLEVLAALFNNEQCTSVEPSDLGSSKGEYFRAQLRHSRLNYVNEMSSRKILESSGIKALVTGEQLSARHPAGRPFSFQSKAALVFSANRLPRVIDSSKGFWRRWMVVPFNREFTKEERDPDLRARIIRDELAGVYRWAIQGADRLVQNARYTEPHSCRQRWQKWKLESNPIETFMREAVAKELPADFTATEGTKRSHVYRAYRQWCKENGRHPKNATAFYGELTRLGFVQKKHSARFLNVELHEPNNYGASSHLRIV